MCHRSFPTAALLPFVLFTIFPVPTLAGIATHDVDLASVSGGSRQIIGGDNNGFVTTNTRGAARIAAQRQVIQPSQYSQLPDHRPQNDHGQELAHERHQEDGDQEQEEDQEQYEPVLPYLIPNSKQYPYARIFQYPPPFHVPRLPHQYQTHYRYYPNPNPFQYPVKYPYARPGPILRPPYMLPEEYYPRLHHYPPPTWITGRSGVSGPAILPGRPLGKWPCDPIHSVPCHNERFCVAREAVCDGINDCGDMADETGCVAPVPANCTQLDFQCSNHECVPLLWRCDGEADCIDSSDELNCTTSPCTDHEFSCGDGSCISSAMHCNQIADCPDSSDEINCDEPHFPSCDRDELACKYPLCVLNEYMCDGDNDCGDWSDEKDCETPRRGVAGGVIGFSSIDAVCTAEHFRCTNGTCIPKRARCDGHGDCDSGEDEERCENSERYPNTCPSGQRACNAGRCIAAAWFCDGEPDCSGGEDEQNCPLTCNPDHEYKCLNDLPANGTTVAPIMNRNFVCIRKTQVCDAEFDCPQKDDEAGCPVPYTCDKNSPCDLCLKAANGSGICGCRVGYTLHSDGVKCIDVNECSEEHGPCQHNCQNVLGSFLCSCREGYVLRPDQRGCKRVGSIAKLIISNRVDIREVNLNTLYSSVLISGLHNAVALDIHYERGEIYWIDFSMHEVKRTFINGTGDTVLVSWGIQEPNGLAVDWVHDIMLWTDSYWRRIQAANLDGTSIYTVVHTGLDKPRDIAVSPKHGLIFWTDWGPNPRVERAGLDGSNRKAIITKQTDWPNGLALDAAGERIYWADARYHVIETAKIDGSDRKVLIEKGLPHPFALTVLEEEIYWTDWHTRSVMAADKTGNRRRTLLNRLHFPMQVHSFHNSSQRPAPSRCPKPPNHCRYLCLPNEQSYTCVCPIGTKLLKDGVTCERVPKLALLYIRNKEIRIRGIPKDKDAKDMALMAAAEEVVPVDAVRSAVSLDWDEDEDLIFWSDKKTKTINCAHRNGTGLRVILDTHIQNPAAISFDYGTRRMYFIDTLNKRIESVDLQGNLRVVVIGENLYSPQSLVVHPPACQMVWSDYRDTKKQSVYIEKAEMDGANRRILKVIPTSSPILVTLAVDPRNGRIYWTNSGSETIESMMFDGSGESTIERPNAGTPIGLSVLAGRIFWADNATGQIRDNQSEAALRAGVTNLRGLSIWHDTRHKLPNPCSAANNNGGCAHICLLAFPSPAITCKCRIGYTLLDDKRTCSKWPSTSLLMVKNSEVLRFPLNMPYTLSEVMPIPKMTNVAAADVDTITGEIYWIEADSGIILRVPSGGGNDTRIVVKHIGRSYGLAVDAISRNIYWTDSAKRTLEVQQIDAGYRRVLIWEGLENPYSVVTMTSHGYLFWSDWGQEMGKIERAQMDGYERASILSENIGWPNALTVDIREERIYWTDLKTNTVESAKIDGSSRKVVLRDRPEPYGIALYGESIYWSDAKTMALHMVNRKTNVEMSVMTGLRAVLSLKVLAHPNDTKAQTKTNNSLTCDRSKCSHLCLPVPKKGYSCACPTGLPLLPGGTTCGVLPEAELFFALGRGPAMGRMALPPVRFHDTPITPQGVHHTTALDFHYQKKLVVFVSSHYRMMSHGKQQTSSIMAINLENLTQPFMIVNVTDGYVEGIAVDWVSDNLFWTDVSRAMIQVARLTDGSSRRTIVRSSSNSSSLRSIAVFPRRGWIFWSDWLTDGNPVARIERAGLDGSNRTVIVETDLERPNGLTIDYQAHKLYWADSGRGRIESSNFSGSERIQLVPEAPHLFGLTMHAEYVYWTNYELHTVERANKLTGRNRIAFDTAMMDIRDVKVISERRQRPGGACAVNNGGCPHLCLARPHGYLCACPDDKGSCVEEEKSYEDPSTDYPEQGGPMPGLFNLHKDTGIPPTMAKLLVLLVSSIVMLLVCGTIAGIIYWRRNMKGGTAKYQPSDPVVITFSNPNYYSEGQSTDSITDGNPSNTGCVGLPDADVDVDAADVATDRYPILWRRLKYDKTMECVTIGLGNAEATALISAASSPVASATSVMAATDSSVIA